uniref:Proteasome assembly chaperone 3 n=1 Tax=Craspedostauros australis TaxID=1486917 RepID=A0A7R9ZM44_9STRA|mmetsp:Transcript_17623/g.48933  ORF Transcript_17623/g.48933 Transcript_17623/m.48933 type:complete len:170 (+) Transcript_17623:201-710(+)|eukprot:CAMPEP_0198119852 /NCGR_PEP_ID=MMETSP1442-20131203/27253_1 /TAXON_ID= /ORGANISM="Craspedostauros australis, Strain CCMP3328" /LENGTH=169 /DNA_ID=CAMNT_0043778407 /DNA_START=184 /DNA_END=693 /DNA_ORIENTATION=+
MAESITESLSTTHLDDASKTNTSAAATPTFDIRPSPASLPTTTIRSYAIFDIPTDVWVELYGDRIVVGVSQMEGGRVGNYVQCHAQTNPVDQRVEFTVTNVLGAREDGMLGLYARRLTQLLLPHHQRTEFLEVLLAISLRKERQEDTDMFKTVVDVLVKQVVETMGMRR